MNKHQPDSGQSIRVTLRLWGNDLEPDTVTEHLGLSATFSQRKGDTKTLSSGQVSKPRELGLWSYEASHTGTVEETMSRLLRQVSVESLKQIDGVEIAIIDLYLGLADDQEKIEGSFECRVDQFTMEKLSRLGADLRITVA